MKKLLKICLCMFLIFSLCSVSFADVGANDAFVTKEEFDNALANFNRRLSAFEAGINSKIDSQVTSYLDRNGIWSGKQQVINATDAVKDLLPPTITIASSKASGTNRWGSYTYITNVDKSGLLVGAWQYRNKSGTNNNQTRWGWFGEMSAAGNWTQDNGFFLVFNFYEIEKGTTVEVRKYSNSFLGELGHPRTFITDATSYFLGGPLPASNIINPFQFFVQKDSKITWDVNLIYHFTNIASATAHSTSDVATLVVEVLDAQVY